MEKEMAMTHNQQQDLFVEWDLYSPKQQEAILAEYRRKNNGNYSRKELLNFLKQKLEIEGYWEKIGLT